VTNPFAPAVPAAEQQQPAQASQQQAPAAQNPFQQGYSSTGRHESVSPMQHVQQTYAQQQAPQAYAPPANPYAQPQQAAPMGYPNQPTYAAPSPAAAAAPALDRSRLGAAPPPPPSGDGKGAKWSDMYGRLVLVFPLSFETKPKNPRFITDVDRAAGNVMQEQITATVVVLDDGQGGNTPISWGGSPMPPVPPTDHAPLPYVRKAMWISQSKIIAQLKPNLPTVPSGAPGMVLGRVFKAGNEHNSPWYLEPATEVDITRAGQYLDLVAAGTFPHPLAA
jgi:hypothetical protein